MDSFLNKSISNVTTVCPSNGTQQLGFEQSAKLVGVCQSNDDWRTDYKLDLGTVLDQPSVSGFHEDDYPNLAAAYNLELNDVALIKRSPLPREIIDQLNHMQSNYCMGLFPQISRAWVTVDSDLFIWNYESNDLAYYDCLSHSIVCVGLVVPKPCVFQPHVNYLLCIATVVDIVLLAVHLTSPSDEMQVLPDVLFKLPTDGSIISDVACTITGRIFVSSKDSCLYEIDYQDKGWFRRFCKKINHSKGLLSSLMPSFASFAFAENDSMAQLAIDESRGILYTRSEKGNIQAFDLGSDGACMSKFADLSAEAVLYSATSVAQNIEPALFKGIINISPVGLSDSAYISLVAVTQRGVRFYFSCYEGVVAKGRPVCLRLVHVRFPPGFSASSTVPRLQNVHMAYGCGDLNVFLAATNDENDHMLVCSSSNFPFTYQFSETTALSYIRGRSWAIKEQPQSRSFSRKTAEVQPPTVAKQHLETSRRLTVLSTQGTHVFERLRPIDCLITLLREKGPDSVQLHGFFQLHGADQACCMCLTIACSPWIIELQVAELATRVLFTHGGCPTVQPHLERTDENLQLQSRFYGRQTDVLSVRQMRQPSLTVLSTSLLASHPQMGGYEVQFSARHNALYYYFGRIVRNLWNEKLISDEMRDQKEVIMNAAVLDQISWLLDQLCRLRDFLTRHSIGKGLTHPIKTLADNEQESRFTSFMRPERSDLQSPASISRKFQVEAEAAEKQSMISFCHLVQRSIEVFGLWKILSEHQLGVVLSSLPQFQELKEVLKDMSFAQLVVSGSSMCSDLCTCLIGLYIGDSATVDAITNRLRSTCPCLYTSEDALLAKANEILQSAKSMADGDFKDGALREAVELYKKVAQPLNLPKICQQFQEVMAFESIVELCLATAKRYDPQNLGLMYYKQTDVDKAVDVEAKKAFDDRSIAYRCIVDACSYLLSGGLNRSAKLMPNIVEYCLDQMLALVFGCDDELAHVVLYEWLIQKEMQEKLLSVSSQYLESYLHSSIRQGGVNIISYSDILWRYYERNHQYLQATKLLDKMADMHSTAIDLSQRINYLSRALVCAKCSEFDSSLDGFLQLLEDKLEVAALQRKILDSLKQLRSTPYVVEAIGRLNLELYDITQLYADFAEEFNLPECKLAILSSSGYQDNALVEKLWEEIVDAELIQTQEASVDIKLKAIETRITALSKVYRKNYFPSCFLTKLLLVKGFENSFETSSLVQMLLELGISPLTVQDVLHSIYKSSESVLGATRRSRSYLFHCCLSLYHMFLSAPVKYLVADTERRQFVAQCLDAVSAYLVDLDSQGTTKDSTELKEAFHGVQRRMQRVVF